MFEETRKCARSSRLQVGGMTHLGRAHRLNCTSFGRACVVITGKVRSQHNEWALTLDKGLRYLSTKAWCLACVLRPNLWFHHWQPMQIVFNKN